VDAQTLLFIDYVVIGY